jgi:phage-related protein
MITFNGVALEQVAPVRIVDVRVSPIAMIATARQRPVAWGADFVRLTGGSRTVSIEFALLTMDRDTRQSQLAAVTRWARSDTPGKLTLPNRRGAYLEAICTALPEPSLRQWWESKLRLVFTTFDNPYWTSVEEKSVACGTSFVVLGDAPPLMRIERDLTSSIANQTYSNGVENMTFSEIPDGLLTIDLNRQTAAIENLGSIMEYYVFGSSFLIPRIGAQAITGTGVVKWHERWN